ncbi:hypothetical protein GHT09_015737 [Marmota monax]|uniref:Uncharacterized protein n=1 Tax=Marmota monax TaxID=9995 RepID=A0A834UJI4_MARMO|nr:hypothetical protein GHT09_015737 [Marmota monax]
MSFLLLVAAVPLTEPTTARTLANPKTQDTTKSTAAYRASTMPGAASRFPAMLLPRAHPPGRLHQAPRLDLCSRSARGSHCPGTSSALSPVDLNVGCPPWGRLTVPAAILGSHKQGEEALSQGRGQRCC